MTYNELKKRLDSFTDEQLDMNVVVYINLPDEELNLTSVSVDILDGQPYIEAADDIGEGL